MDHVCFTLPVRAGQAANARTFLNQLDGERRAEFDQSERQIGITKELWYLAELSGGQHLILYMESADFGRAMQMFVGSREPFDLWFKEQLLGVTGVDLNNPPADLAPAELLSHYETSSVRV